MPAVKLLSNVPNWEQRPWKAEIEVACGHVQRARVLAARPRLVTEGIFEKDKPAKFRDHTSDAVVADCGYQYAGLAGVTIAAHAHLIAAAPDLYEALNELQDALAGSGLADEISVWIIDLMDAALAKARGETPDAQR